MKYKARWEGALLAFKKECALESEATGAQEDLRHFVEERKEKEKLEQRTKKAEEERKKADMQRDLDEKEFAKKRLANEEEIAKLKKANEKLSNEVERLHQEILQSLEAIMDRLTKLCTMVVGWISWRFINSRVV